jgi:hypothetical protein
MYINIVDALDNYNERIWITIDVLRIDYETFTSSCHVDIHDVTLLSLALQTNFILPLPLTSVFGALLVVK